MNKNISDVNKKLDDSGVYFEYPSFEFISAPSMENIKQFEIAARTCYRSEDKMTKDLSSAEDLLEKILKLNHGAMIEFLPDMMIKMRTNRGVTHELVRMRLCSFAQESTRYVRYKEVPFILPWWASASSISESPMLPKNKLFLASCMTCADVYSDRLAVGCSPQEARGSLNNDTAAYINVKTNIREWLHIFNLRTAPEAHPDMRLIMCGIVDYLKNNNPLFDFIFKKYSYSKNLSWFRKSHYVETIEKIHYIVPYVDAHTGLDEGDAWADK